MISLMIAGSRRSRGGVAAGAEAAGVSFTLSRLHRAVY
jgi:hypothetical protein